MDCILCEEPLGPDEPQVHNECGLRSAVGGIGHLLDHAHFCDTDPDAGLDFRTSALLVDILVRRMGLEMFTAAISPAPPRLLGVGRIDGPHWWVWRFHRS